MRRSGTLAVLALLLFFCHRSMVSQARSSDRITFSCACNDSTGKLFASALRETLDRHDVRFREIAVSRVAQPAAATFSIVSLPLGDDSRGESHSTALSIVFLRDGVMLDHLVETCDRAAVDSCARGTVAAFVSTLRTH